MSDCLQPREQQHTSLPCPFPSSWSLLKFMSIELVMPSNHVILHHPLLLLPSVFPSTSVFSNDLALPIWWPKYFYALSAGNRCEWINLITSIPLLTTFQSKLSCFLFLQLRSSFPPWCEGGEVSAWTTPAWNPRPPPDLGICSSSHHSANGFNVTFSEKYSWPPLLK